MSDWDSEVMRLQKLLNDLYPEEPKGYSILDTVKGYFVLFVNKTGKKLSVWMEEEPDRNRVYKLNGKRYTVRDYLKC